MSSKKLKVLFVASEATPFVMTGGLGEVAGSLTKSLSEKYKDDIDIRVIMPLYKSIADIVKNSFEYVANTLVSLTWRKQYCGIFQTVYNNVTYYFIDNEYYFNRDNFYGEFDDGERFAFFAKAVLKVLPLIDFIPDVLHCNDWQTALIPVYLKTKYKDKRIYNKIKSIMTIHNIEYQGIYNKNIAEDVFELYNDEKSIVEYNGVINLLKGALETCDIISTVSQTYSKEIFSDFFAHGLANIIEKNASKVKGILNGIDTSIYDPLTDKALFRNYSIESIGDKKLNKIALQGMLGLPQHEDVPLVAIISRLVNHKGMDIVTNAVEEMLKERIQLVILGKGDRGYELFFHALEERYHGKVSVRIDYNNDSSRKIYAGADMFLMPSRNEPCGISQMIASRYGAVPIVRETGGLSDSIKDCGLGNGNGFTFADCTKESLITCLKRALTLYNNKENWDNLVKTVMSVDFSWEHSAVEYYNMYLQLSAH